MAKTTTDRTIKPRIFETDRLALIGFSIDYGCFVVSTVESLPRLIIRRHLIAIARAGVRLEPRTNHRNKLSTVQFILLVTTNIFRCDNTGPALFVKFYFKFLFIPPHRFVDEFQVPQLQNMVRVDSQPRNKVGGQCVRLGK